MRQIRKFQESHPDVDVVWRSVGQPLSVKERALLSGTSGHPIMVFWSGDNQSVVIGETSSEELARHLAEVLHHLREVTERRGDLKLRKKTKSGATCP